MANATALINTGIAVHSGDQNMPILESPARTPTNKYHSGINAIDESNPGAGWYTD
jgi:hypothetical protein